MAKKEEGTDKMEKIISLCKRRGFVFPGSEIYGGLANTWDYGPYGVLLKRNVKNFWWQTFVQERNDIVGLDASILMNPKVWEASGHVGSFSDPLTECRNCHFRGRVDQIIEEYVEHEFNEFLGNFIRSLQKQMNIPTTAPHKGKKIVPLADKNKKPIKLAIKGKEGKIYNSDENLSITYDFEENKIDKAALCHTILQHTFKHKCPKCGKCDWTIPKEFNLMFKTHQGVVEETASAVYLRPETAQGIFVNFKNIVQTCRQRIPFGVAQIGKAFRNEITPGNFTYRTREFEQMEIEYFISPEKKDVKKQFEEWKKTCWQWYLDLGIKKENLKFREHEADELSHYSTMTFDIEYQFPFGWGELMGLAYRGCFDLTQHQEFSGKDLSYLDPQTNQKYIPHVIEPSFGADRSVLITLLDAYDEDEIGGEKRTVMRFDPKISPIKVAIFPLMKKEGLPEIAGKIYNDLKKHFEVEYDDSGAIGKRYRRQDEIGTPFCLTVDFDSKTDKTVTLRERDSTKQKRVKIKDLFSIIKEKISS